MRPTLDDATRRSFLEAGTTEERSGGVSARWEGEPAEAKGGGAATA
jgi:hypothetical protein